MTGWLSVALFLVALALAYGMFRCWQDAQSAREEHIQAWEKGAAVAQGMITTELRGVEVRFGRDSRGGYASLSLWDVWQGVRGTGAMDLGDVSIVRGAPKGASSPGMSAWLAAQDFLHVIARHGIEWRCNTIGADVHRDTAQLVDLINGPLPRAWLSLDYPAALQATAGAEYAAALGAAPGVSRRAVA